MTGMETVIKLRRAGMKPKAVFVYLVPFAPRDDYALEPTGIVTVNIARTDRLSDIDLRPLVGLVVHVHDSDDDRARHRALAAMVAEEEPALLVMPCLAPDGAVTLHKRYAGTPARTETVAL